MQSSLWQSQENNMQVIRIRATYSYIGDFTDFLIKYEQKIKNFMTDYEIQSKVDQLQDGREVKSFIFTNRNVNVRFLPNRIDYDFSFVNQGVKSEEAYFAAKDYFTRLAKEFSHLAAQRIAIVCQGFIPNGNNEAISTFNSKFGFVNTFGECNELKLKINNPKTLFEPINSVLNIDMGEAKNNKTQEVTKVLLVNIDVNTLASNTNPRFNPKKFSEDFHELFAEAEMKHSALIKY